MVWYFALFLLQQPLDMTAANSNPYTAQADVDQGKKLLQGAGPRAATDLG